ncbi:MAG: glycoside hydrolase family 97 catalytic domain-containing protein [Sedimentisphaerales bacterium]|nr:glycoside hydrolase family 97 catalytic domain-containing protein [Sedimentisphaerales bacterium]
MSNNDKRRQTRSRDREVPSDLKTFRLHSRRNSAVSACILLLLVPWHWAAAGHVVKSPDENVVVTFDLSDAAGRDGCPVYQVEYKGRTVLGESRLGLDLEDAPDLDAGLVVAETQSSGSDTTWSPVYGQWETIRDRYNQLVVTLAEKAAPHRRLIVTFRAYNEGAAFGYTVPEQKNVKNLVIAAEKTQFRFLADHTAHAVYSAQGQYNKVPLGEVKNNCERPLTLELKDGGFAAVAEARLVDYARMKLSPVKDQPYALISSLAGKVEASTPLTTPWRVLMIAETSGELLECSTLILNLNDACAIADTSWIKPGKVIREVTLTTAGGKACVDFAAEHNLQYVEYDAGWYGHEYSDESDATTISVDPKRSPGPLDLHAVIEYAKQRDIGILVYVNRRALERQLDEILPLYESWGIKGVKYGFVQVGSQKWTAWLHEAVRKAAKHHLMVDVHDEYRPTGYSRTYPNFMTQEGIRGNECMPTAGENLVLPFTRMLCGAGDYTVCYYNNRIKTTHAHQLAAAVVFYSPWQFLFWYDRPAAYQGEPEIEFFDHIPTVWDDTRVINGKIGEYITIARRSGGEWFIGTMNGMETRTLNIPLTFLDRDRDYTAHVYSDGDLNDNTRTHVKCERRRVSRNTILTAEMPPSGGHAVRMVPAPESGSP